MATTTATINIYDHVAERIADGGIDLDNDSFEWRLTSSAHTPADSDTVIGDIDNELSGNGYSVVTATSVTWNRTTNVATFDCADPVWTASGGSLVFRNWHLYDTTAGLLIAYGLVDSTPADVTTTDGNTFTLNVSGSGLFTVTV
ncbi:MAG: hypothetical protein AAF434_17245 [Pseudomonadota bacterium]